MWEKLRKTDLGIKFTVVMVAYLSVSHLLALWLSLPLAQGLAIPIVIVPSYPILLQHGGRFLRTALLTLLLGLMVYLLLRLFSH